MSNKLLRSELKEIVKECLVEILSEGIGSNSNVSLTEGRREINKRKRSSFDHVTWQKENRQEKERDIDYREHANSMTSDPILAEVLADSQRTMNEQIRAESLGHSAMAGDFADRRAAESDPEDLFGSAAQNWATLAFE